MEVGSKQLPALNLHMDIMVGWSVPCSHYALLFCVLLLLYLQHNGGYIVDNRMNFVFGTSERGSLERTFDALQAELDALGVSDGLTRQQVRCLTGGCDTCACQVGFLAAAIPCMQWVRLQVVVALPIEMCAFGHVANA